MRNETNGNLLQRFISWLLGLFGLDRSPQHDAAGNDGNPSHESIDHDEKIGIQIDVVREAFGGNVAIATKELGSKSASEFLYRPDHILVAADRLDEVRRYLADAGERFEGIGRPVAGENGATVLYELPARTGPESGTALTTLNELDDAFGAGVCSPDHVIYVTYKLGGLCPAHEPDVPNRDLPWPRESRDTGRGAGVIINVVDTGWWKPAAQDPDAPWLASGVDGDAEQINPAAIHPYGGHGTFVAGVIRCQAPAAQIYVDGMLTKGGAIFESELMKQLDIAVLDGDAPNIISISGGTHTYGDRPLLTFEHLAQKHNLINNPKAPLIVAAAGNDKTDAPFWPAAYDWVVGVGSLDEDDTVSAYSNYGNWVDIYALGRDHVNAFPTGTYTCYEPPNVGKVRHFKNLAKWSGTSFSTPLVTGMIAGLMTDHGLTAHEAWTRLKADSIVRTDPKIGKILTVDTPGD